MPNLEEFLNKEKEVKNKLTFDIVQGSFSCQNLECDQIITEGNLDREKNRIFWVCINGHKSSVII